MHLELSKAALHPLSDALVSAHDSLLVYDNVGGISPGLAHPRSDRDRVCFDNHAGKVHQAGLFA